MDTDNFDELLDSYSHDFSFMRNFKEKQNMRKVERLQKKMSTVRKELSKAKSTLPQLSGTSGSIAKTRKDRDGKYVIDVPNEANIRRKTYVPSPQSLEKINEIRNIVFDPRFKMALNQYNKVIDGLKKAMGNLVNSKVLNGLMVYGAPGMGKSHAMLNALDDMKKRGVNLQYYVIKGKITALALYEFVKQHPGEHDICIFDDCDSIFNDEASMNLVKAMADTYPERVVSYRSRAASAPSFIFKGKLICITNQDLNSGAHFDALKDRMPLYTLTLTFEQKFAKSVDIMISDPRYIHDPAYKERADYVIKYMNDHIAAFNIPTYSLRTTIRLMGIYELVGPDGFDTFVRSMKEFKWSAIKPKVGR